MVSRCRAHSLVEGPCSVREFKSGLLARSVASVGTEPGVRAALGVEHGVLDSIGQPGAAARFSENIYYAMAGWENVSSQNGLAARSKCEWSVQTQGNLTKVHSLLVFPRFNHRSRGGRSLAAARTRCSGERRMRSGMIAAQHWPGKKNLADSLIPESVAYTSVPAECPLSARRFRRIMGRDGRNGKTAGR